MSILECRQMKTYVQTLGHLHDLVDQGVINNIADAPGTIISLKADNAACQDSLASITSDDNNCQVDDNNCQSTLASVSANAAVLQGALDALNTFQGLGLGQTGYNAPILDAQSAASAAEAFVNNNNIAILAQKANADVQAACNTQEVYEAPSTDGLSNLCHTLCANGLQFSTWTDCSYSS